MKLNLDLSPHFWIGLFLFVCSGITVGTIHLTGAVPDSWIRPITAWAGIFNFIGTGYLTGALLLHNADPQTRRDLAAAVPNTMVVTTAPNVVPATVASKLAAMPDVQGVISTQDVAANTVSEKVVATAAKLPKAA